MAHEKDCKRCGVTKPLTDFTKRSQAADGLQPWCRPCMGQNMKDWRAANPEREQIRNRRGLLARYGVDQAWYDQKVAEQGNRCAVCGGEPRTQFWDIDHDHRCCPKGGTSCGRCLRGLAHGDCNRALGLFRDEPNALLHAAAYLITHEEPIRV